MKLFFRHRTVIIFIEVEGEEEEEIDDDRDLISHITMN
jgi:hypothetical protein